MDILAVEALLDDFAAQLSASSSWEKTRAWFDGNGGEELDDVGLRLAILRQGNFLADPDTWDVILKNSFFLGKEFSVAVGSYEIQENLFLPGDNLMPFLPSSCPPSSATFSYKGRDLPARTIELSREILEKRFALFGKAEASLLISIEHLKAKPKGRKRDAEYPDDDARVRSIAFDAACLYADPGFDPVRGLILSMPALNHFEIRPRPADPGKAGQEKSMQALERGFSQVFARFPPDIGIGVQIAHAYWLAFRRFAPRILPAIAEYMARPGAPQTVEWGIDSSLRPYDPAATRPAGAISPLPSGYSHPCAAGRSLDAALAAAGVPIRSSEVEAMLRAAPNSTLSAIEESLSGAFPDALEFKGNGAIRENLEGLLDYVKTNTDHFREARLAGPRNQALSQFLIFLARWVKSLGDRSFELRSANDRVAVEQLLSELRTIIIFLNAPPPMDDSRLSDLSASITELCAALDLLLSPIAQKPARASNAVTPRRTKRDDKAYIVSASLAGVKPPVMRRLSIPGSFSLSLVSRCVLSAFGWSGNHLHCFRVNEKTYGQLDDSSLPRELDESDVLLDDLPLIPDSQFEYEYDFNSSWIILLRVEQVVMNPENAAPRCLAGMGASPPEECGGPLKLMRAIKGWKDKSSPDYAQFAKVFGADWNPSSFDQSGTDKRFSALAAGHNGGAP
jgi:hypothetical protein